MLARIAAIALIVWAARTLLSMLPHDDGMDDERTILGGLLLAVIVLATAVGVMQWPA